MGYVEVRVAVNEKGSSPAFQGNGGCPRRAAGAFRVEQAQDAPSFGVQRPAGSAGCVRIPKKSVTIHPSAEDSVGNFVAAIGGMKGL
jgi:hypothetical protein